MHFRRLTALLAAIALLVLTGCPETGGESDADASTGRDTGFVDTTDTQPGPDTADSGVDTADTTPGDAGDAGDVALDPCHDVKFEYEAPDAESVWVTGTFTGWAATPEEGAVELTNDGSGTWSTVHTIGMSGQHQYKFIVDGDRWVTDPENPNTVDDGQGGENSVLHVCKGGSMTHEPCQEVTFEWRGNADTVWVTGTFTGWADSPEKGALTLQETESGLWQLETVIEPKGRHQYKFIIDDKRWIADPGNSETVDDGQGGQNSVLVVCSEDPVGGTCEPREFSWRSTVMYFAMIDRFRDGDGMANPVPGASDGDAATGPSGQYEGGDLQGATDKLNYLNDLGVSALWLSAPYENRDEAGASINPNADSHTYSAYHGYWPSPADIDYTNPDNPQPKPTVESRIGDAQDLRNLISKAHGLQTANGHEMKVLFDYVMNHVDKNSGLYQAHPGWFARKDGQIATCGGQNLWNDPYWSTRCAFTKYLPPFDFSQKAPRDWSVNDALWWAEEFDIDGYRLDAIKHVPTKWLTQLRSRLNSEIQSDERFYLVGETFAYDNRPQIGKYVNPKTMLDGQFDFPFKARLCEALFRPGGRLDSFSSWLRDNQGYYGQGAIMTTWIGNHDIPRAIHFASGQIQNCRAGSSPQNGWNPSSYRQPTDAAPYERLGLAFAVMMTTNAGIPLIYYGDEVGLAGGGDPDNRRMMPWDDSELNAHQKELRSTVKKLAKMRAKHPVLARGQRRTLSAGQDTWVWEMSGCGEEPIVVAVNRADSARSVQIPAGSYTNLRDESSMGGGMTSIPARGFVVLQESGS